MSQKKTRLFFYISTGLLTLMMIMSAGMYFFNYEQVSAIFSDLGFPTYIIYPLAVAKILGLIAIWSNLSQTLKEWAYAGFFFDFILAFSAHVYAIDGEYMPSLVAIIVLLISYYFEKKVRG